MYSLIPRLRPASFPGSAQLFVTCSTASDNKLGGAWAGLQVMKSWVGPGNKATLCTYMVGHPPTGCAHELEVGNKSGNNIRRAEGEGNRNIAC